MLRSAIFAFRRIPSIRPLAVPYFKTGGINDCISKNFATYKNNCVTSRIPFGITNGFLMSNKQVLAISDKISVPVRTVTKFSLNKGKRKTVKAVIRRFFRLHWGGWIRPKVGRQKRLWKKSLAQRRRLRQHVFCNSTQSTLLDKMVTKFWKKPKYYVEDPYAPYHKREEFNITRKKPIIRY